MRQYPVLSDQMSFEAINENIKTKIIIEVKKECKRYVIGAIYGDTDGTFYTFILGCEILKLHPDVLSFFQKYKNILLKLNHYEWIKFLERVNRKRIPTPWPKNLITLLKEVTLLFTGTCYMMFSAGITAFIAGIR